MARLNWQKSTYSTGEGANCVEVAVDGDGVRRLRESDDPAGVVTTSRPALGALLAGVKVGDFGVSLCG